MGYRLEWINMFGQQIRGMFYRNGPIRQISKGLAHVHTSLLTFCTYSVPCRVIQSWLKILYVYTLCSKAHIIGIIMLNKMSLD